MADAIDSNKFRKILAQTTFFPLGLALSLAVVFVVLTLNLLKANREVALTEKNIAAAHEVMELTIDGETGMRGYIIAGKENFLEPYHRATSEILPRIRELEKSLEGDAQALTLLHDFNSDYQVWANFARNLVELRRNGGSTRAEFIVGNEVGKRKMDLLRGRFASFIRDQQGMLAERSQREEYSTKVSLIIILILSLATGTVLAWYNRRQLISISNAYNRSLQSETAANDTLREEEWQQTGQAQVSRELLGDLTTQEVGRRILKVLADYLDVKVGVVYAVADDGDLLSVATYGVDQEYADKLTKPIKQGEGLVGQVAIDRSHKILQEVPRDYFKISSGLGEASPSSLVIFPIVHIGAAVGVLELGFSLVPDKRAVDLLHRVSESISLSLLSSVSKRKLQEFLEKTQVMNEELQAQQEELRTANEELEEQSRILRESQARLENQQVELEQTNEQLEEQAQALAQQQDILTQRNEAISKQRQDLEIKTAEIQRASQYKSEFLANMSHELRTPLNSTLILAKLLSDNLQGNLTVEQINFANSIYNAGNDLLNLINDILDLSKVEAGKLEIRLEEISVADLCKNTSSVVSPLAQTKKIDLTCNVDNAVPKFLRSDRQRVEQILKNLLSNAIKFTDQGYVQLNVGFDKPNNLVSFAVADSGIGIPSEQQETIFEAFRQADGTTNRKFGGTGLGLSISRDLAKLLGGRIDLRSQTGKGSTFTLFLPVEFSVPALEVVETREQLLPAISLPGKKMAAPFPDDRENLEKGTRKILIIEDEVQFAQILFDLAHEMRFKCLVAHSGSEGLAMAAMYKPDGILLDIKLPDFSGLTVLDKLKTDGRTRHIPVHILSSHDNAETTLQMGAIGHLVKPSDRNEIRKAFSRLEEKVSQKIKQVLVVEDNADQREAICKLVEDVDVRIFSVGTGREALEQLEKLKFDCLIMDLSLPDMSGFELLEKISASETKSFLPVIVYTGKELSAAEENRLRRYSSSIILKGARSPERLLDEVTLFLHKVETQMAPERQKMLKEIRSRENTFERRRILLVDDDVRNIFALTSALEQRGAWVGIARNGREALEKLDQTSEPFDLVIMDIMMPEMDGYEATREIRKQKRFAKLPIVAITAKAMKDDQELCLRAGANDYLSKPIDLDKLFSLLKIWLPKSGSA